MYGKKCETSYQDENEPIKCKKELMFDADGVVSRYSGAQLQQIDDVCHSVELEKKMKRRARHQLVSRKLLSQPTTSDATELPGGFWRDTATVEVLLLLLYNIDCVVIYFGNIVWSNSHYGVFIHRTNIGLSRFNLKRCSKRKINWSTVATLIRFLVAKEFAGLSVLVRMTCIAYPELKV